MPYAQYKVCFSCIQCKFLRKPCCIQGTKSAILVHVELLWKQCQHLSHNSLSELDICALLLKYQQHGGYCWKEIFEYRAEHRRVCNWNFFAIFHLSLLIIAILEIVFQFSIWAFEGFRSSFLFVASFKHFSTY